MFNTAEKERNPDWAEYSFGWSRGVSFRVGEYGGRRTGVYHLGRMWWGSASYIRMV